MINRSAFLNGIQYAYSYNESWCKKRKLEVTDDYSKQFLVKFSDFIGGTFFMDPEDLRTYARAAAWPSVQSHRMIGFRAVREP